MFANNQNRVFDLSCLDELQALGKPLTIQFQMPEFIYNKKVRIKSFVYCPDPEFDSLRIE